jgi:hypothetical protein
VSRICSDPVRHRLVSVMRRAFSTFKNFLTRIAGEEVGRSNPGLKFSNLATFVTSMNKVWHDVKLPAGKILSRELVEHPELVARHDQYRSN